MHLYSNSNNRWKWLIFLAVPIVALGVIGKMTNTNPPTNIAQTSPDAMPALRTRTYAQSRDEVMKAAQTIASQQKTWFRSWRAGQVSEGTIEIEVPVIFFTDDLVVSVDTHDGQTRVNVKSNSRVGQGDFGENRRHIAQFLRALDEKLAN